LDCVSDFLFWGVVLMYFIGIGDGASRLLCIFVWRFLVRYYTHFFSLLRPSFQLSQSTASVRHSHARVCSKRLWLWLSTREEKRREETKQERRKKPVRVAIPHTRPSTSTTHLPDPLLFSKTASAAVSFSPLTTAPSPSSSSAPSLLFARSCSSSLILM
jgi:hypothetical protein